MKIAIDGTTLTGRDGSPGAGIEQYTRMISESMIENAGSDEVRVIKPIGRIPFLSRHLSVPLQALLWGADILFCPSGQIPLGWKKKSVIVIHDLSIFEHPEWFPATGFGNLARVRRSLNRSSQIIAISEATKKQFSLLFPEFLTKTSVVYPGTNLTHMLQIGFESDGTSDGRMDRNLILSVGTLEPRKNLVNALAAFDAFLRMHPDRAADTRFMLAGKIGWKADSILEAMSQINAVWQKLAGGDVVTHLGYVTEGEKQSLYAQASCLFFPSLYEGFGLPALEAMAAGCPVIVSDRGALLEVCADAAMYVDPENIEQMAFTLAQCVMMPEAMSEMVEAAKNRANRFTWQRASSEVLKLIQQ